VADLKRSVEAILFASDRPVTPAQLREVFPDATAEQIRAAVEALRTEYADRAFEVLEIAGGWQVMTRPEHGETIARFRKMKMERRFTPATLDTLAIIAYRQPVTRAEVEAVRGAASGEIIRALLDAGLVRVAGRAEAPGAPLLYATTQKFLETFGLARIEDLPRPQEMAK
jgi:segregation and condensation protein B